MSQEQSNTRVGDLRVLAGILLTDLEGHLVKMSHDGGIAEILLPTANDDHVPYVLLEGAADEAYVDVRPIESGRNVRIRLEGTCNPGDVMVLADVATPADAGMVRVCPVVSGTYRGLGVAEEIGVDGQLVLVRPALIGNITVL